MKKLPVVLPNGQVRELEQREVTPAKLEELAAEAGIVTFIVRDADGNLLTPDTFNARSSLERVIIEEYNEAKGGFLCLFTKGKNL